MEFKMHNRTSGGQFNANIGLQNKKNLLRENTPIGHQTVHPKTNPRVPSP
jgi:hypothetical protein